MTKNREHQELFKEVTSLTIPKFFILTRWGTWIEFVTWLFDHFSEVSRFINCLSIEIYDKEDILSTINEESFEDEI